MTRRLKSILALLAGNAIGLLLRKRQSQLNDYQVLRAQLRSRRDAIRDTQLRLLMLNDERSDLLNLDQVVNTFVNKQIGQQQQGTGRTLTEQQLKDTARTILTNRRKTLNSLIQNSNAYFETLVELDSTQRQLVEMVTQYEQYIDERILWVRSGDVLGWNSLLRAKDALLWCLAPANWQELECKSSSTSMVSTLSSSDDPIPHIAQAVFS